MLFNLDMGVQGFPGDFKLNWNFLGDSDGSQCYWDGTQGFWKGQIEALSGPDRQGG